MPQLNKGGKFVLEDPGSVQTGGYNSPPRRWRNTALPGKERYICSPEAK